MTIYMFYYIVAAINSKNCDLISYACLWPQQPQDTILVSRGKLTLPFYVATIATYH